MNGKNPSDNFMVKKIFPLSAAMGSEVEGDHFSVIKIENSEITLKGMKGGFETESGRKITWDLSFSHYLPPFQPAPTIGKLLKLTKNFWNPIHPNFRVSGIINFDGNKRILTHAPGEQSHTYGLSYQEPFIWSHVQTIKNNPDAWFNVGCKPGKGVVALFDGERDWFFNSLLQILKAEYTQDLTKITFKTESKEAIIEGEVSVPSVDYLIGSEYVGPLGNRLYCYNSELADMDVHLGIKDDNGEICQWKEFIAEKTASFETNWLEPQEHAPPYLPWDAEELKK